MKKILCYGDSNTFGFNPEDGSRFDENTRWTAILQKNLINDYEITEEGMCDNFGHTKIKPSVDGLGILFKRKEIL